MSQLGDDIPAAPLANVRGDVAIVGMACTFPGARNLTEFWRNIVGGVDCVGDVPAGRWDPELFYDPDPSAKDKLSCKRGGYLGSSFSFNPLKYGTMPRAVEGAEPDQFLVLRTVHEAIEDAGYLHRDLNSTRACFVLGRGNYLGAGLSNLLQRCVITEQTLAILRTLHPGISSEQLAAIRRELQSRLPGFFSDTAPGLIPNITTGRVANRLDLTGASFTVDAACASSLIATELAVRDLLTGQCDLALAGGVHVFTDVPFLTVFTALGALSQSGMIRPFDHDCDGTLPGEGVGIVVLKRAADALRDGDRVYAIVKGVGSSSDGRALSVTAPRVDGEVLALRRAYAMSGCDPRTVELIEAHGTGTPVGDPTELDALRSVFGTRDGAYPTCALGSVKSMIGHAMPAAGVASLIKTALSLYHRVLPPTLHCRRPQESLAKLDGRFYLNTATRPWIHGAADSPRRAGINAFGFGGVNAHVVLEESPQPAGASYAGDFESELCIVCADSKEGLGKEIARLRAYLAAAPGVCLRDVAFTLNCNPVGEHRLAIVARSLDDLADKLERAAERLAKPDCRQIKDTAGIYYFGEPTLRRGKVAFLFPGLGSQYVNMFSQLCVHFPDVRACFDELDRVVQGTDESALSGDIFPPPSFDEAQVKRAEERVAKIERANPALLTANGAMFTLLTRLGIRADMMTGHSSGEWVALPASRMTAVDRFVAGMSRLQDVWSKLAEDRAVPRMVMLAVGADRERVERFAAEAHVSVDVVNDNCPHQVVVVAALEDAEAVRSEFLAQGVFVERMPYEHGYHSPKFGYVTDALREYFRGLNLVPPNTTVYSCATAAPYPAETGQVVELLANTFARPVRFRETIEAMYAAGARVFVEVGPRANLCAFVDDILRGREHLCAATNHHRRGDIDSLHHALAKLAAFHVPMTVESLYAPRSARRLTWDPATDRLVAEETAPGVMQVPLHYRLMRVSSPLTAATSVSTPPTKDADVPPAGGVDAPCAAPMTLASAAAGAASSDAMQSHFRLMEEFLGTQEAVMQAYLASAAASVASPATTPSRLLESERTAPPVSKPLANTAAAQPDGHSSVSSTADTFEEAPAQPTRLLADLLIEVVSERTGYPPDMLSLDADMEADLGIDSIKRVEILGTLQQKAGSAAVRANVDMEGVAKLKTLRQVLAFLESAGGAAPPAATDASRLAFPGHVVRIIAGQEAVARRRIDLSEELYLEDHRFGPQLSEVDPTLRALPVVPLTVSVETMAEAAALLMPGLRVIGARDVQASKWIDIPYEGAVVEIEVQASVIAPTLVRTQVRVVSGAAAGAAPVAEGTIVFSAQYPTMPELREFTLNEQRPCMHTAEELYSLRRMFHGPSFQGVASLDACGRDGLLAELEVLPVNQLFRSNPSPSFHIDPFLLDAAGQLVGYWPVEYLDDGFVLFPIRIRELVLYRDNLPPGERAKCRLRIGEVASRQLRADMDIVAPDGRLWMRIIGWEDWRFYWARNFYDFWRFPNEGYVSEPLVVLAGDGTADIECRRMAPFGEMGSSIWENLWAHLICSRDELATYHALPEGKRRTEWIFGRAAAKDAVRSWVKRRTGLDLYPADVVIVQDAEGKPTVHGYWVHKLGAAPSVSISHKAAYAVAAAGPHAVGIDLESVTTRDESFLGVAFDAAERNLLQSVNGRSRDEWIARAWSAKEAAGKAFGTGLSDGPSTVRIGQIIEEGDQIHIACHAALPSAQAGNPRTLLVKSVRDGDFVLGLAIDVERDHGR